MTVSTLETKVIYQGNGAAISFVVPFQVDDLEDIFCRLVINGVESEAADFDVVQVGDNITVNYPLTGPPLPFSQQLIIYRSTPLVQDIDLQEGSDFYAETHEDVFDRLTMQVQEVSERVDRAVLVGMSEGEPPNLLDIYDEVKIFADQAAESAVDSEASAIRSEQSAGRARENANEAANQANRAENAAASIPGFTQNAQVFFGFTVDKNFNLTLTTSEEGDRLKVSDYDVWAVLPVQSRFYMEASSLILELPHQPPYE